MNKTDKDFSQIKKEAEKSLLLIKIIEYLEYEKTEKISCLSNELKAKLNSYKDSKISGFQQLHEMKLLTLDLSDFYNPTFFDEILMIFMLQKSLDFLLLEAENIDGVK